MKVLRKIFKELKTPKSVTVVLSIILTLALTGGVIVSFVVDLAGMEYIAYLLYGLSAISLSYTVYAIVIISSKWKASVIVCLNKSAFIKRLTQSYGYRAIIFATSALLFGLLYGAFLMTLCILNKSVWYGVLAGFYIIISISRLIVVLSRKAVKNKAGSIEKLSASYAKTHINCGILLIISTFALIVAVLQMVFLQRAFSYNGIMIYVAALYAFYKITIAIINLIKRRKNRDLNLEAVRNLNLVDAMVSILALQTALLNAFGGDSDTSLFNIITGGVVCTVTLVIAIAMIRIGSAELKKMKNGEKASGE